MSLCVSSCLFPLCLGFLQGRHREEARSWPKQGGEPTSWAPQGGEVATTGSGRGGLCGGLFVHFCVTLCRLVTLNLASLCAGGCAHVFPFCNSLRIRK